MANLNNALLFSTYVVERNFKTIISMALNFYDDSGNLVLITKGQILTQRQTLETPTGDVMCTIIHTSPLTHEIRAGGPDGNVIGIIHQNFNINTLIGKQSINIENQAGEVIAIAKGDFINSEFYITTNQGDRIADVLQNEKGGVVEGIKEMVMQKYALHILEKDKVPTLTLLGFLVVLEMILKRGSYR